MENKSIVILLYGSSSLLVVVVSVVGGNLFSLAQRISRRERHKASTTKGAFAFCSPTAMMEISSN